jgi:NAD(P)-dependent dehydrogenase (short-subunit alcohol dehydrogenase family)
MFLEIPCFVVVCFLIGIVAVYIQIFTTVPTIQRLPENYILAMATSRFPEADPLSPLRHQIAIVTGSTDGLGKSIALDLYKLGATVVIASRNLEKCKSVEREIRYLNLTNAGTVDSIRLDVSDFDSVKSFVEIFHSKYRSLDWLVNNAGIHYASSPANAEETYRSAQGFDKAFATNYLGHFILTDKLYSLLAKTGEGRKLPTRVVNIASTYHALSDGSYLRVGSEREGPSAARNILNDRHLNEAYANSKLAQILHAKELSKRKAISNGTSVQKPVEFVSLCPGWVATNILPQNTIGHFIKNRAFLSQDATQCAMCALFSPQISGGEFITNYWNFFLEQNWTPHFFASLTALGLRTPITHLLSIYVLLTQKFTFKCWFSTSSPESYDPSLAANLYDWSLEVTQKWRNS